MDTNKYKIITNLDRVVINYENYKRIQIYKIYIPDIRCLDDLLAFTIVNRIITAQNFRYRKFK